MADRDATHDLYASGRGADFYARSTELQGAEVALFDRFVRPGMRVLDIGVGTGRTTQYLAPSSSRYVGVDYSAAMIERSRQRFPGLDLRLMDATDLSALDDASFDAVVFSFNGLGSLPDDASRQRCLSECARVLGPGGVFILSMHNARYLLFPPDLRGVSFARAAWRILYAGVASARNVWHRLPSRAYRRGRGFVVDPNLFGLTIYATDPAAFAEELRQFGLEVREVLCAAHPAKRPSALTPWYYYACQRVR